jgi:hypothetical protein
MKWNGMNPFIEFDLVGILLHTCAFQAAATVFSVGPLSVRRVFGKLVLSSLQSGTRGRT